MHKKRMNFVDYYDCQNNLLEILYSRVINQLHFIQWNLTYFKFQRVDFLRKRLQLARNVQIINTIQVLNSNPRESGSYEQRKRVHDVSNTQCASV